jgi:2-polyprenyl-6-methoxyphenol hydroxylase-like FAD-dependent oxidoreductase
MQIAVIGAGPVGLSMALALAQAGAAVKVYEASDEISKQWRASTFHPPTLEQLEKLVSVPDMISNGIRADHYQIRDRASGLVADFDYRVLKSDTPYPFRLQLEQYKLSEMVLARLQLEPRVELNFGHELVGLELSAASGVTLTLQTRGGELSADFDYVVGADGASSFVRQSSGLGYDGWTYQERFLLISSHLAFDDYLPDLCHVNYLADPHEFAMVLRTPDVWRVLVPVPTEVTDDEARDPARLQSILEGIVGQSLSLDELQIEQTQIYRVHQRVASSFRLGRALLVGDAAHVNSPIGGFGLNSGLHDAFDLAARFERIIRDGADPSKELDAFAAGRRSVALDYIQRMSHQNTTTLMEADDRVRAAELRRLGTVAADPQLAREWLLERSMIRAVQEHGIGQRPEERAEGHAGTVA